MASAPWSITSFPGLPTSVTVTLTECQSASMALMSVKFCLFDKRWEQMSSILCHWIENTAPEELFHFFSRVCHGRTLFLVLVLVSLLCMLQNIYSRKAAFFIFLSFSA